MGQRKYSIDVVVDGQRKHSTDVVVVGEETLDRQAWYWWGRGNT